MIVCFNAHIFMPISIKSLSNIILPKRARDLMPNNREKKKEYRMKQLADFIVIDIDDAVANMNLPYFSFDLYVAHSFTSLPMCRYTLLNGPTVVADAVDM